MVQGPSTVEKRAVFIDALNQVPQELRKLAKAFDITGNKTVGDRLREHANDVSYNMFKLTEQLDSEINADFDACMKAQADTLNALTKKETSIGQLAADKTEGGIPT